MRNLKDEMEKEYKNVDITDEKSDVIFNNILNIHNKKKKTKVVLFNTSLVLIIMIFGFGITYAEELKQSFNNLRVKYFQKVIDDKEIFMTDVKSDSKATINSKAELFLDNKYSYNDLTTKLGINILNNSLFKKKDFTIKNIEKKEDNIGFLLLGIDNVFDEHPDEITEEGNIYNHEYINCNFEVSIATEYSEREPGRVYSSSNKIEEIYISSLDTKAIAARLGGEFSDTIWDVRFDYNNISYHLELFFFTSGNHRDELLKILNSFNI